MRRARRDICTLSLVVLISLQPIAAQDAPDRAILEKQGRTGFGVPLFPANHIAFFTGEYAVDSYRVSVYIVEESADDIPGTWSVFPCEAVTVQRGVPLENGNDTFLIPLDGESMALFSGPGEDFDWCAFLSAFRSRYLFFVEAIGAEPAPPLPAVLEF